MNQNRSPAVVKDRVRATRYVPRHAISVATKTIGTTISFRMETENLSLSGLLLAWNQRRVIPFIENTIIELVIDPNCEILRKPLACLGKIVRKNERLDQDLGPMFGVAIVQMDANDTSMWEDCLSQIADSGAMIAAQPELAAG